MPDKETIIKFVRDALGCRCPDEVFNQIDVAFGTKSGDSPVLARIVIGGRLLIYLAEMDSRGKPDLFLENLICEGKHERDGGGLNRFRLVIVSEDTAVNETLVNIFDTKKANDEKMHLHIISRKDTRLKELLSLDNRG